MCLTLVMPALSNEEKNKLKIRGGLRKRALEAAYGGGLQWRKISILVDQRQISVVSVANCYATGALRRIIDLYLLVLLLHVLVGPNLFPGGHANNILWGPCQQLLTLKSCLGLAGICPRKSPLL